MRPHIDAGVAAELPREVPLWLRRALPGPEGPPREMLVVSTAGNKQTGLYSHVEQVLAVFVDDAAAEIENYDAPNEAARRARVVPLSCASRLRRDRSFARTCLDCVSDERQCDLARVRSLRTK